MAKTARKLSAKKIFQWLEIAGRARGKWRVAGSLFCAFLFLGLTGCAQKHVVYLPPAPVQKEVIRKESPPPVPSKNTFPHQERNAQLKQRLAQFFQDWKGVPYLLGGKSKRGIDCSALMQHAYRSLYHRRLPRTTREQVRLGRKVRRKALRWGDLVFFKIGRRTQHVGMYIGENRFLHAGESTGVTISELEHSSTNPAAYWAGRFWCARRL